MKRKLLSMVLVLALILTACGSEEKKEEAPEATAEAVAEEASEETAQEDEGDGSWAIYWYLCGSDLESEYGCATTDISEILEVPLPENVKIVIQTGGASEWQNELVKANKIGRYEVVNEDLELIEEKKQASMGDGDTLKDFLAFCNENYPADHKMVVFWDHGGGTTSGAAQDENFDGDMLSLAEIRTAFEETCEVSTENPPYDIIGFDTCLMATVDVASIFKDVGRYLVGSEECEPGLGWCYNGWIGALAKDTTIAPVELGKVICDTYYKACEEGDQADEATLSVTDLSKIDPVLETYNALGDEALVNLMDDEAFAGEFARATKKTENYGGNTDKSGYSDMADMGDLAKHIEELLPNSTQAVQSAIADAVVYQVKGKYKSHANGLSCFVNYSHDEDKLNDYINASATEAFDYYYTYNLTDNLDENGYNYIQNLLGGEEIQERVPFDIKELEDHKLKIEDGSTAVLNIGRENASRLASVCYELYTTFDDGESFVCLGSAATPDDVTADWEKGIFKDNFRGMWGSIDGNFVYMELVSAGEDYTMYQVPIKLNGDQMYLSIACDTATHEFTIIGARKEMENGVSSKEFRKLQVGDEITPILYTFDENNVAEFETDAFTVTEDTAFEELELGDGNYAIDFEMTGNDGKTATSEIELFVVHDSVMEYL